MNKQNTMICCSLLPFLFLFHSNTTDLGDHTLNNNKKGKLPKSSYYLDFVCNFEAVVIICEAWHFTNAVNIIQVLLYIYIWYIIHRRLLHDFICVVQSDCIAVPNVRMRVKEWVSVCVCTWYGCAPGDNHVHILLITVVHSAHTHGLCSCSYTTKSLRWTAWAFTTQTHIKNEYNVNEILLMQ